MAICPFAKLRAVPNHGGPMGSILGVVIHVTAGEGDPYNEFANPANQVSSHFGIGNGQGGMADGAIEQYVDTSLESWAQVAGNKNYISVETEGQPGDPLTAAQVASFGKLMDWLHSTHGVVLAITDTPGAKGFITHGDGGSAWGGHEGCPGDLRKAQRAAILVAAGSSPSPIQEELSMLAYDPDSGGFWATDENGDLANENGAPFVQGLNQHPEYKAGQAESGGTQPCVGITAFKDKNGEHGICYATRLTGTTDVSGLRFYRFARNGTSD